MELFAAGFNAWRQLEFDAPLPPRPDGDDEPEDIRSFRPVLAESSSSSSIDKPYASLAYTLGPLLCTTAAVPRTPSHATLSSQIDRGNVQYGRARTRTVRAFSLRRLVPISGGDCSPARQPWRETGRSRVSRSQPILPPPPLPQLPCSQKDSRHKSIARRSTASCSTRR